MTALSPLQLVHHCFTHLSLAANPEGTPSGKIDLEPTVSFQQNPENSNQWMLQLRVIMKSASPQAPFLYEADVAIQGTVEVLESFPTERRERLAVVNGLGLLYSAVREMLLIMTSRSARGQMCLPTINFIEVVAKNTPSKKATEPTSVSAGPGKTNQ